MANPRGMPNVGACLSRRTRENTKNYDFARILVRRSEGNLRLGKLVHYGEILSNVKKWLAEQFQMKYLGEASYILRIQIIRDRKNKLLALCKASYIDKVLARFSMQDSRKGQLPTRHGIILSKEQCLKTPQEEENMRRIPYASTVGSLIYAMLCTRPDICYAVGIVSRYQSNPGMGH